MSEPTDCASCLRRREKRERQHREMMIKYRKRLVAQREYLRKEQEKMEHDGKMMREEDERVAKEMTINAMVVGFAFILFSHVAEWPTVHLCVGTVLVVIGWWGMVHQT